MSRYHSIKEHQLYVLSTNIILWNRYVRFCRHSGKDFRAELSHADLEGADLTGAALDFALHFYCKWLCIKLDSKLAIQMLYHVAKPHQEHAIKDIDEDLKQLLDSELFKKVCNKFHRVEECGVIK